MVWVSNYASVTIVVSVTDGPSGGSGSEYTKQNETWDKNHWARDGEETITIRWPSGRKNSFKIGKDARVIVYDDAVGITTTEFVRV